MAAAHRFNDILGPRLAIGRLWNGDAHLTLGEGRQAGSLAIGPTDQGLTRTFGSGGHRPLIE